MVFDIIERIKDDDFDAIRKTSDQEIILDLKKVEYLGSRDITRLLVITKEGKQVKFKNSNSHIIETLYVLKIEDIIKII